MVDTAQAERIRALEVQMNILARSIIDHNADDKEFHKSVDAKLDILLDLRAKGVGAFWLASAILGTGIVGALATLMSWFKDVFN